MENFDRLLQIIGIVIGLLGLFWGIKFVIPKLTLSKGIVNFIIILIIVFILMQQRFQALQTYVILAGLIYFFAQGFNKKE